MSGLRSLPWLRRRAAATGLRVGLVALVVVLAGCGPKAARPADTETPGTLVPVLKGDAEMEAAIAQARATLPEFWSAFDQRPPGSGDFALKLRLADDVTAEYFWLTDLERQAGRIYGTLGNDPQYVKIHRRGARVEIPEADICDWMYIRDGKIVGNRTLRAVFKNMPPEEVEWYKARLAEP